MSSGSGKAREMDADTAARIMIRPLRDGTHL